MFITFKSSNAQKRKGGGVDMEQMVARNAHRPKPAASASLVPPVPVEREPASALPSVPTPPPPTTTTATTHPMRQFSPGSRPPCISCQGKKLLCTGLLRDCDRCIARSQACLFSMTRPQARRRQTPSSSASLSASASGSVSGNGDFNQSPSTSPSDHSDLSAPTHNNPIQTSKAPSVLLGQGALVDHEQDEDRDRDQEDHDLDLDQNQDQDQDPYTNSGFDDTHMYSHADMLSHFGLQPEQQHALAMQFATVTAQSPEHHLTSTSVFAVTGSQGQDIISTVDDPNDLANFGMAGLQRPSTTPNSAIFDTRNPPTSLHNNNNNNNNGSKPNTAFVSPAGYSSFSTCQKVSSGEKPTSHSLSESCACLNDLLGVVQQLDDDHFGITKLSLDQVLHLQKWLMAQCNKPLRCQSCHLLPTVHSVLVIICDRLTEMFECIHKRTKRIHQRVLSNEEAASQSEAMDLIYPAQLFCGSTGEIAGLATCNPALFKPAFQDSYSFMEQIHMMKALLNLQADSFRELLVRVRSSNQALGSQARLSKVASLMSRVDKAVANIDEVMQSISIFCDT